MEVQGSDRALLIPLGESRAHRAWPQRRAAPRRELRLAPPRDPRARPAGARILDDRSSNGTFVNGRRVQQAELRNGDVIVLGRVMLRYIEV